MIFFILVMDWLPTFDQFHLNAIVKQPSAWFCRRIMSNPGDMP